METTADAFQSGNEAPRSDWKPARIGADFGQPLVLVEIQAYKEVMAACGVSPGLVDGEGEGAALRESWRQFLYSTLQPLSEIVLEEVREKLDPSITFNWDSIGASDLSGRARAFQSMVGAGMDVAKAAALAGLMEAE